jgi:hypothetical protein
MVTKSTREMDMCSFRGIKEEMFLLFIIDGDS